jgi:hypothetical protein
MFLVVSLFQLYRYISTGCCNLFSDGGGEICGVAARTASAGYVLGVLIGVIGISYSVRERYRQKKNAKPNEQMPTGDNS